MNSNAPLHVVFGCNGPVGVELMYQLAAAGVQVRGISRSGRAEAPAGATILAGDAANADEARRLAAGASVVYSCIGVDYTRWHELWPPIVEGLIGAAASAGARLVFTDNLYSYGPHDGPLTEDVPLTTVGRKPALRARLTARLLEADAAGRPRVSLVRASDFYGPRTRNSMLGERVFARVLAGKTPQLVGDIDQPHSLAYVPDVARALTVIAGAEDATGILHVPHAAPRTLREVTARVCELAGVPVRVQAIPVWMLRALAPFNPLMRELNDIRFIWDRPYVVDDAKFRRRFGIEPTPLDVGLRATLDWYRTASQARRI